MHRRRQAATGALIAAALVLSSAAAPAAAGGTSGSSPSPAPQPAAAPTPEPGPGAGASHVVSPAQARRLGRPDGLPEGASPTAAARAFATENARALGLRGQLVNPRAARTSAGTHVVRFDQAFSGVPVVGGQVVVEVDPGGEPRGALSETLPTAPPALVPALDAEAAAELAIRSVARAEGVPTRQLQASVPRLSLYDPALLGAPGVGGARLVWRTEVGSATRRSIDQFVLVDALRPAIALSFSQLDLAVENHVCDAVNVPGAEVPCLADQHEELPSAQTDVQDAADHAAATADFYAAVLGRDSIDGAGMPLISTVRYCEPGYACPYANAFWDGSQMVYGQGFASADDVVAHELTHGVTERVNGLFYYFQSGAINESLSDILGELVDLQDGLGVDTTQVRWLLGEDLPGGAIRSMSDPTIYGHPDSMVSPLYASGLNTDRQVVDSGGVHSNSGVGNKFASLLTDGGTFRSTSVPAVGERVTALVVYGAAQLLTSGSDYRAFAAALRQSCASLQQSGVVTADDCAAVDLALSAVAMDSVPTSAPTPLPQQDCQNRPGTTPVLLWSDSFEDPDAGRWQTSGTTSLWYYAGDVTPYAGWVPRYATSGTGNLWADDPPRATSSTIRMPYAIAARTGTFVRFNHAWDFDQDSTGRYDGAVVEYTTSAVPGSWFDAGPLFRSNGYNGRVTSYSGGGNILAGRSAFTGTSNGYRTSYLDLSSLAGQGIRLNFTIAADSSFGGLGWFVDDVVVGACGTAPAAATITAASPGVGSISLEYQPGPDNGLETTFEGRCASTDDPADAVAAAGIAGTVHLPGLSPADSYTCTVVATNALGSTASAATVPVQPLDSVAPVLSAAVPPTYTLTAPVFTATATDNVAVAGFTVRKRTGYPTGSWSAWSTAAQRTGTTLRWTETYKAGATVCLEIRARDASGNVSPAAVRCSSMALDERSMSRSAGWTTLSTTRAFRSTLLRSTKAGEFAQYVGTWGLWGRGLALVVQMRPGGGKVGVYVGGKRVAVVSTASSTTVWKKIITVPTPSFSGAVRLKVETAGSAGVTIDGLAIRR